MASWLSPVFAFWVSVFCVSAAFAQSGGDYVITKSTVDSGGHSNLTGGGYKLAGTVGQHDAGDPTGGGYVLTGGFWSPAVAAVPSPIVPDPAGNRTRYVSFSVPPPVVATGSAGSVALQITMLDLQNPIPANAPQYPPPDFSTYEAGTCAAIGEANGCARWVGPPITALESQDNAGIGNFRGARLQCTPYYHDWESENLIHVTGAEIAPSSGYGVKVYGASCKGNESGCSAVSQSVTMATHRAGDVASPYNPPSTSTQPDGLDVSQIVAKFKNLPGAPKKADVQAQPNLPGLNSDIDAIDIVIVVDNFKGFAYSFSGPCVCPSTVTCNVTPCSSPTPCGNGTCVKACNGGTYADLPCINNNHCPGGSCGVGFCRDRCGRCSP